MKISAYYRSAKYPVEIELQDNRGSKHYLPLTENEALRLMGQINKALLKCYDHCWKGR